MICGLEGSASIFPMGLRIVRENAISRVRRVSHVRLTMRQMEITFAIRCHQREKTLDSPVNVHLSAKVRFVFRRQKLVANVVTMVRRVLLGMTAHKLGRS